MNSSKLLNAEHGKVNRSRFEENIGIADVVSKLGNYTTVCIKDGKTGKVLYSGHNATVLGGRVAQLEELFGLTKNFTQNSMQCLQDSACCFASFWKCVIINAEYQRRGE